MTKKDKRLRALARAKRKCVGCGNLKGFVRVEVEKGGTPLLETEMRIIKQEGKKAWAEFPTMKDEEGRYQREKTKITYKPLADLVKRVALEHWLK